MCTEIKIILNIFLRNYLFDTNPLKTESEVIKIKIKLKLEVQKTIFEIYWTNINVALLLHTYFGCTYLFETVFPNMKIILNYTDDLLEQSFHLAVNDYFQIMFNRPTICNAPLPHQQYFELFYFLLWINNIFYGSRFSKENTFFVDPYEKKFGQPWSI